MSGSSEFGQGNLVVDGKPVCDDSSSDVDARVACRELGFLKGGNATSDSRFGKDLGDVHAMDEVDCKRDEARLSDCTHATEDDCGDSEAAGVICNTLVNHNSVSFAAAESKKMIGRNLSDDTKAWFICQSKDKVTEHFL